MLAGAALFAAAAIAGPFLDGFTASLLALVFLFAFLGQAWNVMLGFIGLLSLGHALFVGLGGYTMAVLLTRYGVRPGSASRPARPWRHWPGSRSAGLGAASRCAASISRF